MDCSPWPARLLCLWNSPGENTWVCSHSLPKSPTTVHQSFRLHLLWLPLNVCILLASFYGVRRHCTACGILAPQPGIEPTPPTLEGEVLTTGPAGRSLCSVCVSVFCCFPVFFGETWGFLQPLKHCYKPNIFFAFKTSRSSYSFLYLILLEISTSIPHGHTQCNMSKMAILPLCHQFSQIAHFHNESCDKHNSSL